MAYSNIAAHRVTRVTLSREAVSVLAYNAVTLSGFLMGVLLGWIMWG